MIEQIAQLPDGEKISKKVVDDVLSGESGRPRKDEERARACDSSCRKRPPHRQQQTTCRPEETPSQPSPAPLAPAAPRGKVNPGKVKLVAELLGLSEEDEETLLARLIDDFLAARNA